MDLNETQLQDARAREQSRRLSSQRIHPPRQVPGYEIGAFLGEGAYGEVWQATKLATGRQVAIKFYTHRGGLDWSLLSREVDTLSFLFNDRYVVQLIDVGWDSDPPYYVMEHFEHGSLERRLLEEGSLSADEAVTLAREVAIGLVHAHGKGVLHCDLKPANVLLDQDGKPRLCDFGQSRLSHEQSPALGTLFYMAPEQADLKSLPDARWDVYALGALLYCMLTGHPPYRSEEAEARLHKAGTLEQRLAIYRRILHESPRPSEHRRVPGVDRHLAEIIDRCLALKPAQRFPNPQAVLSELDARARRRARRPLVVLGAIGPALLLAVVGHFAYHGFSTTVAESEQALTSRTLESHQSTAWAVARHVAAQVENRWQMLAEEARQHALGELIGQHPHPDADRSAPLNRWLDEAKRRHPQHAENVWFITDRRGVQIARHPPADHEQTIGKRFAYRSYFHGQERDYDPQQPDDWEHLGPITEPALSVVFRSTGSGKWTVVFSVPIWSRATSAPTVAGILGMSVDLGHFTEIQTPYAGSTIVLIDSKPESEINGRGRRGSVLEHPVLAQGTRGSDSPPPAPAHVPEKFFVDPQLAEQLVALCQHANGATIPEDLAAAKRRTDYRDPLGVVFPEYAGTWLAAIEPVVVHADDGSARKTGWVVVVQEKKDLALDPVDHVRTQLIRQGATAALTLVVVLGGLWGFVLLILGNNGGPHWLRSLRGRLTGLSTTSGSGLQSRGSRLPKTSRRTPDGTAKS
jgi:hypothetical protein